MNDKRQAFLGSWEQALRRLSEALLLDSSDRIVIDAAIQRFEFCFELGWKTLKAFLEFEGYAPPTPRQTLKDALRIQWLNDEEAWLQMLQDRNLTSHTYHEALADEIYSRLANHHARMSELFGFLNRHL
ncbi:MAG: nucleotidyltransferase [Acidimicrobiia bacterium]|nr:nucleotidyltransferase [Acidimicrobiia bacterium]